MLVSLQALIVATAGYGLFSAAIAKAIPVDDLVVRDADCRDGACKLLEPRVRGGSRFGRGGDEPDAPEGSGETIQNINLQKEKTSGRIS